VRHGRLGRPEEVSSRARKLGSGVELLTAENTSEVRRVRGGEACWRRCVLKWQPKAHHTTGWNNLCIKSPRREAHIMYSAPDDNLSHSSTLCSTIESRIHV
jgi:hypothetical protein